MTILPMVFALVLTGIASRVEASSAGGITRMSLLTFLSILLAGAAITAIVAPSLLTLWPSSPDATEAIRHALADQLGCRRFPGSD